MVYAGRVLLTLVAVAVSVVARPNHLKAVVVDSNPGTAKEVAVSFGGYSAKAGLGGSAEGGGLFASADSPHGSAGAGLGGSAEGGGLFASADSPHGSAGAGLGGGVGVGSHGASGTTGDGSHVGQKPGGHKPGGGFDGIFNIPISVLQAVNSYLNNRGPVTKVHRRHGHTDVVKTVEPAQGEVLGKDDTSALASASSSAEAGVNYSAAGPHKPVVVHKRVNYDDIFNIPISALRAVNQMLNG